MRFRLQEIRKEAGYKSANEFADKIGMSRSTYTKLEQGERTLSLEDAWFFADYFGVTLDALAGRYEYALVNLHDEEEENTEQ